MQHSLGQQGFQHFQALPSSLTPAFTLYNGLKFPNQKHCWISNFYISLFQQGKKPIDFNYCPDCIPGLIPYSLLLLSMSSLDNFQPFRFTAIPSKVFHPQINVTSLFFLKARGKIYRKHTDVWQAHQSKASQYKNPHHEDVLIALTIQSSFKYEQRRIPNGCIAFTTINWYCTETWATEWYMLNQIEPYHISMCHFTMWGQLHSLCKPLFFTLMWK